MMLAITVIVVVLGTTMTAEIEVNNAVELSSSSTSALNSATETLLQQTSSLMGDIGIGDQILSIQQQIRNQLQDGLSRTMSMSMMDTRQYEYLTEALNSAISSSFSPQQLQLINDVVSMTGASYAYDAAKREIDIHRECIAAAYQDLNSAAQIAISGQVDVDNLAQLKNRVLSAVQHLQDSCPLCRALKSAANDANQNFLPFTTVLCSSVLRSLHPFVAESSP